MKDAFWVFFFFLLPQRSIPSLYFIMSDHDSVKPHEERLEHAHPLEATASAQDAEIEPELHWR